MKTKYFYSIAVMVLVPLCIGLIIAVLTGRFHFSNTPNKKDTQNPQQVQNSVQPYTTFASADDFSNYLEQTRDTTNFAGISTVAAADVAVTEAGTEEFDNRASAEEPEKRVSETNVQVVGIDEPDILKTNGESFFYSPEQQLYYAVDTILPEDDANRGAPYSDPVTSVIQALPPEDMQLQATIAGAGDLLLSDTVLLVISAQHVFAYDVSDPSAPKQLWEKSFSDATYQTARLYNGQLYVITTTWPNYDTPCPITAFTSTTLEKEIVPCNRIYHPTTPQDSSQVVSLFTMDPTSGKTTSSFSTIAQGYSSVVYMSPNAIYIADPQQADYVAFFSTFILESEAASELFDAETIAAVRKLQEYGLSPAAESIELEYIINNYFASLPETQETKKRKQYEKALEAYYKEHRRELEQTVITKVSAETLAMEAQGSVPGRPLNQFSLDEHNEHLRIATTVDGNGMYSAESVNDLYILDTALKIVGSVQDLGKEEQIYSTRFIGDVGYMVTFKETDPFYVFDLSDPAYPKQTGELKIPGFSSYLHPLTDTLILGVGQEDFKVKLSLFDVSDPSSPQEVAKAVMDEYSWSEVSQTHHAFLQDADKEIFFLPVGEKALIYSYADAQLQNVKTIEDVNARRAAYINQYLYVFGERMIKVYNEDTWEKIGELTIQE